MQKTLLIFPHQLFSTSYYDPSISFVVLLEDPLFFKDEKYPAYFHKQKLVLHRASMKNYQQELIEAGFHTLYIEAADLRHGEISYEKLFKKLKLSFIEVFDPVDYLIEKRLRKACKNCQIELKLLEAPGFLTGRQAILQYFEPLEHYSFTSFYIAQRKRLNVLLESQGRPLGGKWTYDQENRKKAPQGMKFPSLPKISKTPVIEEACAYVEKNFKDHPGKAEQFFYPVTRKEAQHWLKDFLNNRLELFGPYQDAIVGNELVLMHGLLTPSLNIGLITPQEILKSTLEIFKSHAYPINSVEGFLRQVIGWREFVMGVYRVAQVKQRTHNFWKHTRKIPPSFYDGTTGILPIDMTIKKIHKYAYCHHIERLMVLGSFMLLCEFDPDDIYRWFMEMFIDAYDWVMVPNIYGMSQYADGGLMTTKPYICGSNYIRKMSDYPKGEWCEIWDALFWRFLNKHREFFSNQARLGVLCSQLDRMGAEKLQAHEHLANKFLSQLS
ncbi:MAG: cryptochrome/photolyase family protein [Chlamydiales bacterium 38-26]|nr:cryptochrome/photolyase family protein [Chlamydiales bacterium]OJV08547.1 MAG: cryptochrome/photolyase family protein [Chlamydiales bacterium 38-26]